ncbi:hypothetical protein nbrc107697_13560 [Gordonia crocea]|uniref:Serine/threonine protein kinase n=1 Tax=Gordonia crocea TaxID=589162 RepID=A0A7I9UVS8_9ACTN|nr:hypothetical protein nbrc107697_13560 [Gordonia crocea]
MSVILVAGLAGALLVVGGALGAVLYGKSRDGGSPAAVTAAPYSGDGATTAPTTTATTTTTTTTTETAAPPRYAPPTPSAAPFTGTDWQGFTGNGARCNVDDPAVFIGQTNRSSVVVCRAGETGGLYYAGYADGHRSPDVSWPQMRGSTYVFRAGSTVYEVGPDALVITTPSATVTEPWTAVWPG